MNNLKHLKKLDRNSAAYKAQWGSWEQYAERKLGTRKYAHDERTVYAQYALEGCDNTNLEPDGFCQICDRQHFVIRFGKMFHGGNRREDKGCESFGDTPTSDFIPGSTLMIGSPTADLIDAFDHPQVEVKHSYSIPPAPVKLMSDEEYVQKFAK